MVEHVAERDRKMLASQQPLQSHGFLHEVPSPKGSITCSYHHGGRFSDWQTDNSDTDTWGEHYEMTGLSVACQTLLATTQSERDTRQNCLLPSVPLSGFLDCWLLEP